MRKALQLLPVFLAIFAMRSPAADLLPKTAGQPPVPGRSSSHISAAIIAGLPKYDPQKVVVLQSDESSEIVTLPNFVVSAGKNPAFSERSLYSIDGFAALLRKRYPGASRSTQDPDRFDGRTPNYAALMYLEDKRLARMKEFQDLADTLIHAGDISGSNGLKAEIQRAFCRHEDDLLEAMDISANNGRR